MENGDDWLALDKLYHVLFCFFITVSVSLLVNLSRYSVLRRWSISIGSLASAAAGAAKEAGDEIGLWKSAGASAKDAVADLLGVLIGSAFLLVWKALRYYYGSSGKKSDEMDVVRGVSMV